MTDTKAALDKKFDRWFYTARDPVKDLPYGSHLIYRVCDNDKDRFEIGCELLKAAFVGGHESALTTPPAPTVMGGDVREAVDVLLEAYSRYYSDEANFERKVKEATETIMRNLRAATQPPSTPAALWRQDGSADPHAGKYDCERAQLLMGEMTDDEIANELFMQLPVGMAGIGQAVKDRIRWLSRKLVEATQPPQATDAQRLAALKDINDFMASGDETDWQDVFDIFARHKDTIRAALESPAVPREVVEKARKQIEIGIITHERHRSYDKDGWLFSRIHFDEALALLGGKEG